MQRLRFIFLFSLFSIYIHAITPEENILPQLETSWYTYCINLCKHIDIFSLIPYIETLQYKSFGQLEHDIKLLQDEIKELNTTSSYVSFFRIYKKINLFAYNLQATYTYHQQSIKEQETHAVKHNQIAEIENLKQQIQKADEVFENLREQYQKSKAMFLPICELGASKALQETAKYLKEKELVADSLFFNKTQNIPHHETNSTKSVWFGQTQYMYADPYQLKISGCLEKDGTINNKCVNELAPNLKNSVEFIIILKNLKNIKDGEPFIIPTGKCITYESDLRCRTIQENFEKAMQKESVSETKKSEI